MASYNDIDIDHQVLSEDVIIEILSRLPVKSLIRARVACKNWYTIIKNPSFVTKHFKHHTDNSGRLFVQRTDSSSENIKYVFSLFFDETLAGTPPVYQDVVVVDRTTPAVVVASPYNGILCLSNINGRFGFHRFALWNPATREFRALPVLPRNLPPMGVIDGEVVGFGLDPITNDFKLVWIWKIMYDIDDEMYGIEEIRYGPYQAAVYTLTTDSWRYLDVALPYFRIDSPSSNTCIDGVYHWRAEDIDDQSVNVILSFDMGSELFHEIRDIPCSKSEFATPLLVPYYNNSLALIYYDSSPIIDIWVMMEEGWCWKKQFTMSSTHFPLGFWKNGQLLVLHADDQQAVLYDPETHQIKDLGLHGWEYFLVYRESLVAIKDGDGFLQQDHLSDKVDQVFKIVLSNIAHQPGL